MTLGVVEEGVVLEAQVGSTATRLLPPELHVLGGVVTPLGVPRKPVIRDDHAHGITLQDVLAARAPRTDHVVVCVGREQEHAPAGRPVQGLGEQRAFVHAERDSNRSPSESISSMLMASVRNEPVLRNWKPKSTWSVSRSITRPK